MGLSAEFASGLLDASRPVPALITGQIESRYAVYRNNVTMALISALKANFPVVHKLLGEQYFAGFARDFAQNYPPQSPLMFQYGADFPKALECAKDLASYPYLGDVARLEILWRESYHAADATALSSEALAALEAEVLFNSYFIIHPAARLLQSRFALHSIFAANRSESLVQGVDPAQPQCVLVTRPLYDVAVHAITAEQYTFYEALQNGENFGDALDLVADIDANFDLPSTLALLLQSGAFQSIQTDNEQPR